MLYNNPEIGASCRFFDPMYRKCVVDLKNDVGGGDLVGALWGPSGDCVGALG